MDFFKFLEIEEKSFIWKDFPLYEFFLEFNWKLKRNPQFLDFSFLEGFSFM